jgi:predicted nucleic acid-binding protein
MKNKARDARTHRFVPSDQILPDANIWLYLYGPAANPAAWQVRIYSSVFAGLLTAKSQLYLDVLVLSEFVNRFARIEWKRLAPTITDFKVFRQSASFPPVAQSIQVQVAQILTVCKPVNHHFAEWNLTTLLQEYRAGATDLNDQLLVESCRKHNLAILTNDKDFTDGGINVFTAHRDLLTACPQ